MVFVSHKFEALNDQKAGSTTADDKMSIAVVKEQCPQHNFVQPYTCF
jgi:hypothetical protein